MEQLQAPPGVRVIAKAPELRDHPRYADDSRCISYLDCHPAQAARPDVMQQLQALPGVRVIAKTPELKWRQDNSRIWNETWLSAFFHKPCNHELFVQQSLNMEGALFLYRRCRVSLELHRHCARPPQQVAICCAMCLAWHGTDCTESTAHALQCGGSGCGEAEDSLCNCMSCRFCISSPAQLSMTSHHRRGHQAGAGGGRGLGAAHRHRRADVPRRRVSLLPAGDMSPCRETLNPKP